MSAKQNYTGKSRRQPNPIIDGKRVCLECEKNKEARQFPIVMNSGKEYRRGFCSECHATSERVRRQIQKNLRKEDVVKHIRAALKRKNGRTMYESLLGYTVADLRAHLERQFTKGMSWERYTQGEIHIDHIVPQRCFDLTRESEWKACWSITNLRPAWAKDNMRKGGKREFLL